MKAIELAEDLNFQNIVNKILDKLEEYECKIIHGTVEDTYHCMIKSNSNIELSIKDRISTRDIYEDIDLYNTIGMYKIKMLDLTNIIFEELVEILNKFVDNFILKLNDNKGRGNKKK